ncbi:MAG: hypothetical protein L3J82_05935 [Planctomycetes bacterium]|nr:hypothetical protein [Planctomycetota bacterium]
MKFLTRSVKAAALLLLMSATLVQTSVVAQEVAQPAIEEDEDYPAPQAASPEMIKSFIDAVKASEFFKNATALTPAQIETLVPQWDAIAPAGVVVRTTSLLDRLLEMEFETSEGDWQLQQTEIEAYADTYRQVLIMEYDGENFEVTPAALKELDIDILDWVHVRHPLSRVLASHEVHSKSFASVVAALCNLAKVGYSICADTTRELKISQKTINRTIYSSLDLAAQAAGWTVSVAPNFRSFDGIELLDAHETYLGREVINAFEKPDKPIKTQLDALDHLVRESIKKNDPSKIVVLFKEAKKKE